jgi:formate dehydrogenase subunit gamma
MNEVKDALSAGFLAFCYSLCTFWGSCHFDLAKCGHFFLAAVHPKSKVEFASMMMVPTITKNGLTVCRE